MSHKGESDMDNLLSLAKAIAKDADEAGRKKLLDTLRDVAYSIESPEDTIQRIMFSVRKLRASYNWFHGLTLRNWFRTFSSQVSA